MDKMNKAKKNNKNNKQMNQNMNRTEFAQEYNFELEKDCGDKKAEKNCQKSQKNQ